MNKMILPLLALVLPLESSAQVAIEGPLSLKQCVDYSIENNTSLQKDRLGVAAAAESRREILGSLLPQVNASGGMSYNIQKTTIAMPNFVNSMMPEPMRDPNAPKYMTVTMGMDLSANWGVALSQQLLNFSLFNALKIAKEAENMSQTGVEADTEDVIAKTATLFYNVQILRYSIDLFEENISVMDRMAHIMGANMENGMMRKVDADRIEVTRTNLETEKSSLLQALEVQKNLLKLEMGFPMTEDIELEPLDIDAVVASFNRGMLHDFVVEDQLPFKMIKHQQNMLEYQRKSAISETLPVFSFSGNYSQNYMGDHFYGETFHHFPVSMLSINMRMPIFTGMSKNAKIKKAGLELEKSLRDERMLVQSLTMGYDNALMQMERNKKTFDSQRRNKDLAHEVLQVTESNYNEGLATLSDFLNASSSEIQAQMNYVTAVNNCIKAYIDLRKAAGTIEEITQ